MKDRVALKIGGIAANRNVSFKKYVKLENSFKLQ